jgi:hypothetical protein
MEVTAGQSISVKVHYRGIEERTRLVANLHWNKKNRQRVGYLVSAGSSPMIVGEGVHEFELPVSEKEGIGFISVVVYLSPTGKWNDRTRAVHTGLIPVRPTGKISERRIEKTVSPNIISQEKAVGHNVIGARIESPKEDETRRIKNVSGLINGLIIAFYAAAVLLSGACALRVGNSRLSGTRRTILWWSITAVLIALSVLVQQTFQTGLTGSGRKLSNLLGWYHRRRLFQRLIIAGTVSGWTSVLVMMIRKIRRSRNISWLALFGTVSLSCLFIVRSISFHYVDELSQIHIFGFGLLAIFEVCFLICVYVSAVCTLTRKE